MNHELTLERARPEHAEMLTSIAVESKRHWGYPEQWIRIWIPQLTITRQYIDENETWLASVNGKAAGFVALKQERDGAWWLDHLWVRPGEMGQGVGAALFRQAVKRARARGASALWVESDPNAQSFYEKMGAHKVGESVGEVEGQPRILPVMEIYIK